MQYYAKKMTQFNRWYFFSKLSKIKIKVICTSLIHVHCTTNRQQRYPFGSRPPTLPPVRQFDHFSNWIFPLENLVKNWRNLLIIFTLPSPVLTRTSTPQTSYVSNSHFSCSFLKHFFVIQKLIQKFIQSRSCNKTSKF